MVAARPSNVVGLLEDRPDVLKMGRRDTGAESATPLSRALQTNAAKQVGHRAPQVVSGPRANIVTFLLVGWHSSVHCAHALLVLALAGKDRASGECRFHDASRVC